MECCDPIIPPVNCPPRCNPEVSTDCVLDPSGYECLGLAEESTQSEINAAIINALCQGVVPCFEFTAVTFATGPGQLVWTNKGVGAQTVQYSSVVNCTTRLRGTFSGTFDYDTFPSFISSIIFTLPVGRRPASGRLYSVTVRLGGSGGGTVYFPGFISISTTGVVVLDVVHLDVSLITGPAVDVWVSLDGIFFEV